MSDSDYTEDTVSMQEYVSLKRKQAKKLQEISNEARQRVADLFSFSTLEDCDEHFSSLIKDLEEHHANTADYQINILAALVPLIKGQKEDGDVSPLWANQFSVNKWSFYRNLSEKSAIKEEAEEILRLPSEWIYEILFNRNEDNIPNLYYKEKEGRN